MPFLQSLFPCFGGGGDEQQHPDCHNQPPKPKEDPPRPLSQAHDYKPPLPISQAPGSHQAPLYRPDTDKKLPPQPSTSDSNAFELSGSSPDLHEMPATHLPATHPLAARRASTATSSDQQPRPSQQSEQPPLSPHSPHSAHFTPHTASTPATSTYQPSEQGDPDAISPVPTNNSASSPYGYAPRGANANMYSNVADALTDRKRMFERLRKANGVDPQQQQQQQMNGGFAGMNHSSFSVAPVEMEAPMHYRPPQQQQQAPVEIGPREHVRNPSGPKELE